MARHRQEPATTRSRKIDARAIADAMIRRASEWAPASAPTSGADAIILKSPQYDELFAQFERLSLDERRDEIARHLHAQASPATRPATIYAPLFAGLGDFAI